MVEPAFEPGHWLWSWIVVSQAHSLPQAAWLWLVKTRSHPSKVHFCSHFPSQKLGCILTLHTHAIDFLAAFFSFPGGTNNGASKPFQIWWNEKAFWQEAKDTEPSRKRNHYIQRRELACCTQGTRSWLRRWVDHGKRWSCTCANAEPGYNRDSFLFFFFLRITILFGHFCVYTTPHVYAFLMKPGVQSAWISLYMCERHISGQTETYLVGTPTWVWTFCANTKSTGTFPKKTVEIHGGIS